MNIMSLDLEMNKPSGNIIQVGVVVGNIMTGKIIEEYEANIHVTEKVDPYITNLTGIDQFDVNNGIELEMSYKHLVDMHHHYNCFRNCLTWGGGDCQYLRSQLALDDERFIFGRRWIDVKTVFLSYMFAMNKPQQAGLEKAMIKLGMQFDGKKHTAKDDAKNTFLIYRELLNLFKKEK